MNTPIHIRIDFQRRRFCLVVKGEPIGHAFATFKSAWWAKVWLEAENT